MPTRRTVGPVGRASGLVNRHSQSASPSQADGLAVIALGLVGWDETTQRRPLAVRATGTHSHACAEARLLPVHPSSGMSCTQGGRDGTSVLLSDDERLVPRTEVL